MRRGCEILHRPHDAPGSHLGSGALIRWADGLRLPQQYRKTSVPAKENLACLQMVLATQAAEWEHGCAIFPALLPLPQYSVLQPMDMTASEASTGKVYYISSTASV